MKKTILASAIAAGLGASMGAHAIALAPSGVGEALLAPYYSTVDGNKTFLTITNTDGTAKAVKVRFREGVGSRDVFDFTLYLSEYDVWSALVFKSGDRVTVATQDTSCTVPDVGVGNGSFSTTRIPADYNGSVMDRISEGHIEILEMAVLGPDDVFDDDIYHAITHVNGAPPEGGCELARTWTAEMAQKNWDEAIRVGQGTLDADTSSADQDLNNPTGGLYAHAAVFNPTDGTYFTYAADALVGWADGVLWFPQNSTGVEELWPYTTDQGLAWDQGVDDNGFVEYFDLPDLSTPAITSGSALFAGTKLAEGNGVTNNTIATISVFRGNSGGPLTAPLFIANPDFNGTNPPGVTLAIGGRAAGGKRLAVTAALMKNALTNDYITSDGYETEWLVTFPTRYLHVNVEGGVDANGDELPAYAAATWPFTAYERAATGEACEEISFEYWDREEGQVSDPGSIDFSPGGTVPDKFQLCYEVNVMAFNQDAGANSAVLRSASVAKYIGLADGYDNGWAALDFSSFGFPGNPWIGLPVTGFMAVADTSGAVARGATFRHHLSSQIYRASTVPD